MKNDIEVRKDVIVNMVMKGETRTYDVACEDWDWDEIFIRQGCVVSTEVKIIPNISERVLIEKDGTKILGQYWQVLG